MMTTLSNIWTEANLSRGGHGDPGAGEAPALTTLTREYEGFPLYLRFPRLIENDALQSRFPVLLVLTHTDPSLARAEVPIMDGQVQTAVRDFKLELGHVLQNHNAFCGDARPSGCCVLRR